MSLLCDLIVTSIPVPSMPFALGGAKLEQVYPIAPLAAGHAPVVGLCWYRSTAFVALHTDREGLPDGAAARCHDAGVCSHLRYSHRVMAAES
ncbi:MAG TPA: WS/DGAT domain-containing protein [Pseudonocardiaceae bacterium]